MADCNQNDAPPRKKGKSGKGGDTGNGFKRGQSGNPGGKRKKTQQDYDLEASCREHVDEAVKTWLTIMQTGKNENARLRAAENLVDRGFGKAAQIVTGKDGKDLFESIKIVFVGADEQRTDR